MNKFPYISILLEYIDKNERLAIYNTIFCDALEAELHELLKLVPQTKLREYKGVTYQYGMWYLRNLGYKSIAGLIMFSGQNNNYEAPEFTDDDFIPLMDLKNKPYEEHNVFEHITDEQLNTEYFTRFSDLLDGCSSKRLIAELERRGIHNQWKYTGHEVPHSYDG